MDYPKDLEALRARVAELEALNKQIGDKARERVQHLEAELKDLKARRRDAEERDARRIDTSMEVTPINEADVTLRRLIQRVAMILQAEKIVIMFHERDAQELVGMAPAYGVDEDRLPFFKVKVENGISGQVFREGKPALFLEASSDSRTQKDMVKLLGVRNGITVPLVIEKRDDENRVTDRTTIGVLHAFDKRHGEEFIEEDVRLLERMSRNVGSIIANLQLYREITEEREELLQTFESLTSGLVLVSPEGRVSQMNASARAIFGQSHEAIGKQVTEVIEHPAVIELFQQQTSGEDLPKVEFNVNIAGLERIFEVQAAAVRSEDGKSLGTVAIFSDVTDIRSIDKMKSSFVAMASHELRTPLTAIKGFASTLLLDDGPDVESRMEFYSIIDQECDRLTRLINDLLNTARIEARESLKPFYEEVDPNEVLVKAMKIQQQTTHKHTLVLDIPEPLPMIVADKDKLDQIVTNLLNNAVKYSPNGGNITIHGTCKDGELLVGIEDQGLGIPKDHLGKVFERFHRVNNEDNRKIYGTGLGLFLVKHLVEQIHLGKIWVESELGHGSTFWFKMPINIDITEAKRINE
ncbi:MAG: PAS domain S-box protein [Armatimonadetes bacterium]|nr:PAS domain S-box protein [Armatimonadota bacterium]